MAAENVAGSADTGLVTADRTGDRVAAAQRGPVGDAVQHVRGAGERIDGTVDPAQVAARDVAA